SVLIASPGSGLTKRAAATRIAERFAGRAYRRPATPAQLTLLLSVFDLADQQGRSFPRAVKEMLKAVLVSPEFLFRIEREGVADHDGNSRLDDYDLASRMSYFLWSGPPDAALLELAAAGQLHEPAVQRAQIVRMIADARCQGFIDNFAGQWLLLRNLVEPSGRVEKHHDDGEFPDAVRQAMVAEATGLFGHILRDGRSVGDFIDPGYTFLNQALATFYGIPGVTGDEMRLVPLSDGRRGGILTLGALLVANSHPDRSSPTRRGRWIVEEVLDKPPAPPPPDIPQLQFTRKENPHATDRQVLEIHRQRAACAGCHRVMDPIGFGLENFDRHAHWREKLGDAPIDATGELPGKLKFDGPAELKKLITKHLDDLARVLAKRVLTYALGRALQYTDDAVLDDIVAKTAASGQRFDTIVIETALSFPFGHRRSGQQVADAAGASPAPTKAQP
ncbi:MAG: DUF1592 domain-containing protein, partial [Planctomycetes bacterium]|nr:DUF1592 domain-containing protein [Planctomycetota bacterium]